MEFSDFIETAIELAIVFLWALVQIVQRYRARGAGTEQPRVAIDSHEASSAASAKPVRTLRPRVEAVSRDLNRGGSTLVPSSRRKLRRRVSEGMVLAAILRKR